MVTVAWLAMMFATSLSCCGAASNEHLDHYYSDVIKTSHGLIQGQTEEVPNGRGQQVKVDVFWGIPYAKPPVGDLRFRRPVPSDPWDGVFNATTPPNSCYQVFGDQLMIVTSPPTPLSEDCLYLNIWRPRCQSFSRCSKSERYGNRTECRQATMLWIHGGLFTLGSSTINLYNGARLAAAECVIVVNVNYRLGPLGFMYLGIEESPGNMGLLDITFALKWVKSNAENFGGCQEKITVFGNSAGGSTGSLFLQSPLTHNLFTNVIIQSGTSTDFWSYQTTEMALEATFKLSKMLNCCSTNKSFVVECLKQVDADYLVAAYLRLIQGLTTLMTPVVDGYFLTQSPFDALSSGALKRTSIQVGSGYNHGLVLLRFLFPDEFSLIFQELNPLLSDQELDQKLNIFLRTFIKQERIQEVIADVKLLYQLSRLQQPDLKEALTLLIDLMEDYFRCSALLQAAFSANVSQDTYLYFFNHTPDITNTPSWIGATHNIELPILFGNNVSDIPAFSPREKRLTQVMMRMWANFARCGNPTPNKHEKPIWPPYTPPDPSNIMLFTESADIRVGRTDRRRCSYWNALPRKYFRVG